MLASGDVQLDAHYEQAGLMLEIAIDPAKPLSARALRAPAGGERIGLRPALWFLLGYCGYFSRGDDFLRSNFLTKLLTDNSSFSGIAIMRTRYVLAFFFFAHTALDLRERPRANKLPPKARARSFEKWLPLSGHRKEG